MSENARFWGITNIVYYKFLCIWNVIRTITQSRVAHISGHEYHEISEQSILQVTDRSGTNQNATLCIWTAFACNNNNLLIR